MTVETVESVETVETIETVDSAETSASKNLEKISFQQQRTRIKKIS